MSSELRRNVRKKTFLQGRIIFNNRASSMNCLIRDMSDGGARLELSETATLPTAFELHIPARATTLRAVLCWRRSGEIGIAFEDHDQPAAPAPDLSPTMVLMRRIAELESENAALRAMLLAPAQSMPAQSMPAATGGTAMSPTA